MEWAAILLSVWEYARNLRRGSHISRIRVLSPLLRDPLQRMAPRCAIAGIRTPHHRRSDCASHVQPRANVNVEEPIRRTQDLAEALRPASRWPRFSGTKRLCGVKGVLCGALKR